MFVVSISHIGVTLLLFRGKKAPMLELPWHFVLVVLFPHIIYRAASFQHQRIQAGRAEFVRSHAARCSRANNDTVIDRLRHSDLRLSKTSTPLRRQQDSSLLEVLTLFFRPCQTFDQSGCDLSSG